MQGAFQRMIASSRQRFEAALAAAPSSADGANPWPRWRTQSAKLDTEELSRLSLLFSWSRAHPRRLCCPAAYQYANFHQTIEAYDDAESLYRCSARPVSSPAA